MGDGGGYRPHPITPVIPHGESTLRPHTELVRGRSVDLKECRFSPPHNLCRNFANMCRVLPPRQACYNLCTGVRPCCIARLASSSGPTVIDEYLIVLFRVTLHATLHVACCTLYKGGPPCKV